jgi:hypothetical protein
VTEESAHIKRAKEILAARENRTGITAKPTGITTLSDIAAAESALAAKEEELRTYQARDHGMRQTIDKDGRVGVVIESFRGEQIDHLRAAVERRRHELLAVKRAFFEGVTVDAIS